MAKSVKINGVTYDSVPYVEIPDSTGNGKAVFYDTSGDDVVASDLPAGKKGHSKSGPVTGTKPIIGAVTGEITKKDDVYNIPAGIHNGEGTAKLSAEAKAAITPKNIKAGANILGVDGDPSVVDTSQGSNLAGAAQISKGFNAWVNGVLVKGAASAATVSQDGSTKVLSIS